MSRKLTHTESAGSRVVKVYRDSESQEFVARLYIDGALYELADSFEPIGYTKADAAASLACIKSTARAMVQA